MKIQTKLGLNTEIVNNQAKIKTALRLSQEDQQTINQLQKEMEKTWKLVNRDKEKRKKKQKRRKRNEKAEKKMKLKKNLKNVSNSIQLLIGIICALNS